MAERIRGCHTNVISPRNPASKVLGGIWSQNFGTAWVIAVVVRAAEVPVGVSSSDGVIFKVGIPAMSAMIWRAGWPTGLIKDKYRKVRLSQLLDYCGYQHNYENAADADTDVGPCWQMRDRDWGVSGGGGGSVGRGSEPGMGRLRRATGIREDGVASVRAGGWRWL